MAPRPRRMMDPDYAGAIRNGIFANLNGTRTTSSDFSTPSIYNGSDKSTSKFKAVMSRTSGVAGRKSNLGEKGALLTANQILRAKSQGAPLTGSASGVKNITLKDAGEVLTQGAFSVNKNGLTMDAANLAFAIVPFGKVGKLAKGLIPVGRRISSAAARVADAATVGNRARRAGAEQLRAAASGAADEASKLRKPTFIGSDFYETTTRQVDSLFDKWERTSTRIGQEAGPSAWQRAQDAAAKTGRTVVRQGNDNIPGLGGERFSLRPTAAEIARSEALDRSTGTLIRQADDLIRGTSPYAGNPAAAARELARRLKALKTGPVRQTPWRKPTNSAL